MFFPRAFYLLYYAATASLLPFLVLYYEEIGLGGRQIGVLAGILPLTSLFAAPLWGEVADTTRRPRRLLLLAITLSLLPAALIPQVETFPVVLLAVLLLAVAQAPVMPLADNAVLEALGARGNEYGRQRLWGAVGWGVSAPVVGAVVERADIAWAFYVYIALMLCSLWAARRLPIAEGGPAAPFGSGIRELLSDWRRAAFLLTAFLGGMALAITHSFLLLYMSHLGSSRTLIGLALTAATVSEFPVFLCAGLLLARFNPALLMLAALLVFAVRMFAYALVTDPWVVLPLQLLHGPSYALLWVAGIAIAQRVAPPGKGNTSQALFAAMVMGLGGAMGGFVGGVLYQELGAVAMFRWTGAGLVGGLLLLGASRFWQLLERDGRNAP